MIVKRDKNNKKLWSTLNNFLQSKRQVLLTSFGVASSIVILRLIGLLQPWELAALDQLFRWQPPKPPDDRIVIIGISEADLEYLRTWPIPDAKIAQAIKTLNRHGARLIGLDIYRNIPVEPGHDELTKVFATVPNLIAIRTFENDSIREVLPPDSIPQEQVGFNNVVLDVDERVRRNLIYLWTDEGTHRSFSLQLAIKYLEKEEIYLNASTEDPLKLQFGKTVLTRFYGNHGAYVNTEDEGYQILGNFSNSEGRFKTFSLTDILEDKIPAEQIRDRIVMIGNTAPSLKDLFLTPYSGGIFKEPQRISGVELHANFLSQLLGAAIEGESLLIKFWVEPLEWAWIFAWSFLGGYLSWRLRSPYKNLISMAILQSVLFIICYVGLLFSWWLPLVPPSIALAGTAIVITGYLAHLEEEFKRSKDFLQGIINTVADPIFVKDRNHKWLVLNQAFANLIGHPIETLINQQPDKFFPPQEATIFWEQAESVFISGQSSEHEESLTDKAGNTYLMATKRSLHKDGSGNLFLVGVLRDITERKQMEEELRRTAAELSRSNEELQVSHNRLRYIAYHDPLTGLPNRKLFYERLIQSVEWAEFNQQSVALMFLDLDGFKLINDTYGHDAGDVLLKTVAQRLKNCLRGTDTVSRLAGDEFTVILPAIFEPNSVKIVAEKILSTITEAILVNDKDEATVTASVGISLYPKDSRDPDSLIKQADQAMYDAKKMGKNQYKFYSVIEQKSQNPKNLSDRSENLFVGQSDN
jgi:diguanylate cyclase (GGDEF)-like protein/PAS domain S-box-containing protein